MDLPLQNLQGCQLSFVVPDSCDEALAHGHGMGAPRTGQGDTGDSSLADGWTGGAASGAAVEHGQHQQGPASGDLAAGFTLISSADEGAKGEQMSLGRRQVQQSSGASPVRSWVTAQPGTVKAVGKSSLGPLGPATA